MTCYDAMPNNRRAAKQKSKQKKLKLRPLGKRFSRSSRARKSDAELRMNTLRTSAMSSTCKSSKSKLEPENELRLKSVRR